MNSRQKPVAVQNLGRLCSEHLPQSRTEFGALRIADFAADANTERSLAMSLHIASQIKNIPAESGVAVTISKGLIETLERCIPLAHCWTGCQPVQIHSSCQSIP